MYLNNLCNLLQALKVHKRCNEIPCLLYCFPLIISTVATVVLLAHMEEEFHSNFLSFVSKPAAACPTEPFCGSDVPDFRSGCN